MTNPTFIRKTLLPLTAWWLFWALAQAVVLHRLHLDWNTAITDAAVSNTLLALAGHITMNTYRFYSGSTTSYVYRLGFAVVLTVLYMMALSFVLQYIFSGNKTYLDFLSASLPVRYMFAFLMIAFMTMLNRLTFYIKEQEENKKRKDEATLLLRNAELNKLRQQLQPHFLFNSLNSISALAGSQPEQARRMIQQLSDFLRGTLKKDEQQLVALSEELTHLQLYLDIEKVRFGHRLKTEIITDDISLDMKLPSLLLQPVVENAIKFGLYDTTGEITISIKTETKNKTLNIKIENPFDEATAKPKQGTGFGLNSMQKRLYLLYARNDLLNTERTHKTFITTLNIPQTT